MDPKGRHHLNGSTRPAAPVLYRECLRNHAAAMGTHALDGCGEFLPSPSSPLSCAACSCHRNFHRKTTFQDHIINSVKHEDDDDDDDDDDDQDNNHNHNHSNEEEEEEAGSLLKLKTGGGITGPAGDGGRRNNIDSNDTSNNNNNRKKRKSRRRSRFSREQKEGMMELAERLGWRLQRRDEDVVNVEEGCTRLGVDRGVFKVWMHNNKQPALDMKRRRRQQQQPPQPQPQPDQPQPPPIVNIVQAPNDDAKGHN